MRRDSRVPGWNSIAFRQYLAWKDGSGLSGGQEEMNGWRKMYYIGYLALIASEAR